MAAAEAAEAACVAELSAELVMQVGDFNTQRSEGPFPTVAVFPGGTYTTASPSGWRLPASAPPRVVPSTWRLSPRWWWYVCHGSGGVAGGGLRRGTDGLKPRQ